MVRIASILRSGARQSVIAVSANAFALSACVTAPFEGPAWMNPALNPDTRAELALAEMTLEEKIGLLHGPSALREPLPEGAIPAAGFIPGIPRLGIPDLKETDAGIGVTNPRGIRPGDGATALPSGLAVAATWNTEIAYEGGAMIGREARDKGFNVLLGGAANLVREPRNGRNFEYPGEDPLLGGRIVGAVISGTQDQGIISASKHFAINAQETGRHVLSANIDEAAFRESDLLLFEIALEIGEPGAIMCAYNRINSQYACENAFILNEVLKGDWGYEGWVLSDWGAVYSTVDAALNGLDQQSGEQYDDLVYFGAPLLAAVQDGRVPVEVIDDKVRRILRTMFRLGIENLPPPQQPDYDRNGDVSQAAAEEAIVLLVNEDGLLPLDANVGSIAVIGGHADVGVLSGGGSSQVVPVGGPAATEPSGFANSSANPLRQIIYHPTAPLDALGAALPDAELSFSDGADVGAAAALAAGADVAIVFATHWATESFDVRGGLVLQDDQDALIAAVAAANPRTVVVLETGGPVLMPWLGDVGAVVAAWYPGTRGAPAIANVLTGAVNPSGRLPVTFPAGVEQLPHPMLPGSDLPVVGPRNSPPPFDVNYREGANVGYRWFDAQGHAPLFAFGHGLSYTTFVYGDLEIADGAELTATFTVTNTGDAEGAEVAQLYVRPPQEGEAKRLAGWAKVPLEPGESRRVSLTADPRLLAQFDVDRNAWRIDAGDYEVHVGRSAIETELEATARMRAQRFDP